MTQETDKSRLKPFPGLRAFMPEESTVFFGREEESREVLDKLLNEKFVTVIGPSGTGKSSLINCGVISQIVNQQAPKDNGWQVISCRPGCDPLGNLARAVSDMVASPAYTQRAFDSVLASLQSGSGLDTVLNERVLMGKGRLLLFIDQLEDLFRYEKGNKSSDKNDVSFFISLLEGLLNSNSAAIYLILSINSDYISEFAHFHHFARSLNESSYLIPVMSPEGYRSAIEGPVKSVGLSIDPELTAMILDSLPERADQLPLFQHAMMRTWSFWNDTDEPERAISSGDYQLAGGISNSLNLHASEFYYQLDKSEKSVCEKLFKTITGSGIDNRGIRIPTTVKDISAITGFTTDSITDTAEKFFGNTGMGLILVRDSQPDEMSVVDIRYDSLLNMWENLKHWMEEEADSVRTYIHLSELSALYQQGKTGLCQPPDLLQAIKWREEQMPTLAWAMRYNPAFERAMVYLRTSEKEYLVSEENRAGLQRRRWKIFRATLFVLIPAVVIFGIFMTTALIKKAQADRIAQIAQKMFINWEKQTHLADSLIEASRIKQMLADSAVRISAERENEALREKNAAEAARISALKTLSVIEEDAQKTSGEKLAEIRKRMLATARAVALKSLQFNGQKDLQSLLAYQAWLFNKKYEGSPSDADIFAGLYNATRQYDDKNYREFKGHSGAVNDLAFLPGGNEFYSAGSDGRILKWSTEGKDNEPQTIRTGTEKIEALAISPLADWLACGLSNSVIRMIPLKGGGTMQFDLKGHSSSITSLIFSYDGKYLYSAALDGNLLKWDLAARTSVNIATGRMSITLIDIASKGNYIASLGSDGRVQVINGDSGSGYMRIEQEGKAIRTIRFRPGDNMLATGYDDGTVDLWDVDARRKVASLKTHEGEVKAIGFNNNPAQMATSGADRILKLWDMNDLSALPVTFSDNKSIIVAIGFSPDGQMVVSGYYDGDVSLVSRPATAEVMVRDLCRSLSRNMTKEEWSAYVGRDIEYEATCPEKELSIKVKEIR